MGVLDIQNWILFCIFTVLITLLATVEGIPMNSKAAGWMNSKADGWMNHNHRDDERSYSHLEGSNKFSKPFESQPPKSSYYSGGNTSNRTLAAILLLTVFGLAATALLVILCSKMTKKEHYDTMKGTVY